MVYVTYRKVSVNVLFAGSWVVPRYIIVPLRIGVKGLFCYLHNMCGLQIRGFIFIKEKNHAGFKRAE